MSLRVRSAEAELMDGAVDYETFRGCLRDLARVNRLSGGYRPTLAFLDRLRLGPGPVTILDAGSGYGDALRAVAAWAARRGVAVRLIGLDLNPWSARAAGEATGEGVPVTWATGDALAWEEPVDVVLSALFTHHLGDGDVVRFLRLMERVARRGWFVNDLHRHPVAAHGFGPLAGLLGMHPMVRHDGPVSFRRSFRAAEWRRLLAEAGVEGAEVKRAFPFRLCVGRVRP